jgi:hypothetical protein
MKRSILILVGTCLVAAPFSIAGTHVGVGIGFRIGAPPPVIVHEAPPPVVVEHAAISPGPGYVWVQGHYEWAGNRWIWMSGAWMYPPQPNARWVNGNWDPQTHQWVASHWELPVVVAPTAPPPVAMTTPPPVVSAPAPVAAPVATEVVVAEPPPPVVQEVVVTSPGPGYIWVGGYWGWAHGRREWFPGHWERPPHGYHHWVEPRWEHRGGSYVFVRGYWR